MGRETLRDLEGSELRLGEEQLVSEFEERKTWILENALLARRLALHLDNNEVEHQIEVGYCISRTGKGMAEGFIEEHGAAVEVGASYSKLRHSAGEHSTTDAGPNG